MSNFKVMAKTALKGFLKTANEVINILFFSSIAGMGFTMGVSIVLVWVLG